MRTHPRPLRLLVPTLLASVAVTLGALHVTDPDAANAADDAASPSVSTVPDKDKIVATLDPPRPTTTSTPAPPAPKPAPKPPAPTVGPTTTQGNIVVAGSAEIADLINDARAKRGLKRATVDMSMWQYASQCAISNIKAGGLSHSRPGCKYENLALVPGKTPNPQQVVNMWLGSPGHARAMLDPKVTAITVGWASNGRYCAVAAEFAVKWN